MKVLRALLAITIIATGILSPLLAATLIPIHEDDARKKPRQTDCV